MLCGWASQSEKRTANGKKGDQTGTEVRTGNYYNFGQSEIIRFKKFTSWKESRKSDESFL